MDRQAVTAVALSPQVARGLGFQCAPFSADQRVALGPADAAIAPRWAKSSASASPAASETAPPATLAAPSAASAPVAPAPGAHPLSIEALRVSLAQWQTQQPGRVQSGGTDTQNLLGPATTKIESQKTNPASEACYRPYVGAQQRREQLQSLSLSLPQSPGDFELSHVAKYPECAVESSSHIPRGTSPSFGSFLEPQRKRRAWGSAGGIPARAPPSAASSTPSTAAAGPFLPFRAVAPESNGAKLQSGPLVSGPANLQTPPANSWNGPVTPALSCKPSLQLEPMPVPMPVHRNDNKENNRVGALQVSFLMELSRRAAQNAQVLAATFPMKTAVRPGGLHRKRPWSVAASPVQPPLHTALFNQGSVATAAAATAAAAAAAHCTPESNRAAHSSSLPAASSSPSHPTRVRSRDESIPSLVYSEALQYSAGPFSPGTSLSGSSSSPSFFPISPVAVPSLAGRLSQPQTASYPHHGGLAGLDKGLLDLELRL